MKRIIAVLLAAIMLCGCMSVSAFATDVKVEDNLFGGEYKTVIEGQCTCNAGQHKDKGDCCIYCPNLDHSLVKSCVTWVTNPDNPEGKKLAAACCVDCTGLVGCRCNCGCAACAKDSVDVDEGDSTLGEFWGPTEQENFINGFQAILKKISDAFDAFFDAIFKFLRIDEVIGK